MAAIDKSGGHALTIREAAAACRVSPRTIRRHLNAGEFPNSYEVKAPETPGGILWKIPLEDLEHAGLSPMLVHPTMLRSAAKPGAGAGASPGTGDGEAGSDG